MKKHGALLLSPNEQSDIIRFAQDRGAYDIWIRYIDLDHEGQWEDWVYGD